MVIDLIKAFINKVLGNMFKGKKQVKLGLYALQTVEKQH